MQEEQQISLSQAAKRVPSRPNTSTLWRWCNKGIPTAGGGRVYLEHRRWGRRIFTTPDALEKFARELAEAEQARYAAEEDARRDMSREGLSTPRTRSAAEREQAVKQAERELDAAGVMEGGEHDS